VISPAWVELRDILGSFMIALLHQSALAAPLHRGATESRSGYCDEATVSPVTLDDLLAEHASIFLDSLWLINTLRSLISANAGAR